MTKEELEALMPVEKPAELNTEFYRSLVNHTAMWGDDSIVKKLGRGWTVNFRGHGHPIIFKTKKEAVEMAGNWVLSVSRDGLNK